MAALSLRQAGRAVLPLPRLRREDQFAFLELHRYAGVVPDLAGDELAGERGFEGALEEALQRARSIDRVVAFAGDVFTSVMMIVE